MRIEIGKITRNFVIFVAILVIITPGVMAKQPYTPPTTTTTFTLSYGDSIVVDGDSATYTGEWDLIDDFYTDMYNSADPETTNSNSFLLSKLYLRYDCGF